MDKDAGNAFGTPRISVALDDVKILRKIEGHVLSLIYRFAIPLYQVKIGIPEQNMMATDQEIKRSAEKKLKICRLMELSLQTNAQNLIYRSRRRSN